jgi:hypothetical protein
MKNKNELVYTNKDKFCLAEFEIILEKIVLCYKKMIDDGVMLKNNENLIRDELFLNYLDNVKVRRELKLTNYLFHRETCENISAGRTDLRISSINTFENPADYFVIECKRIDDKNISDVNGLNAQYIINGIMRFVTDYYSSFNKTNGMIGFIVKKIHIDNKIAKINSLIKQHYPKSNTISLLKKTNSIKQIKSQYISRHVTTSNKKFLLYHLMLDVSKNVFRKSTKNKH